MSLLVALLLSAAPARLEVALAPAAARPGDAVLVSVAGAAEAPQGTLAGRPLGFWRDGQAWRALGALPIETTPGKVAAVVEAGGGRAETALDVVEPGFASATLTVAPGFVEPAPAVRRRMAADRAAFAAAFDRPFAPPLFAGAFALPREARGNGRYGDQRVFNGNQASVHYGLDLRGGRGDPVAAAGDGTVALVRDAYMSGNTVVLWHGAGIFTVYFHLDRTLVKAGDRVTRGQHLGLVGSTGRSTGPHLHWGVKVDGLYVDPDSLLAIDFARAAAPARIAAAPAVAPPVAPEPPPAEAPAGAAPETALSPAAAPR
jgi:murein DD-endopeptidase MepM/ murein hydrolase activator NlpD